MEKRRASIELLRFLAVVMVVLIHIRQSADSGSGNCFCCSSDDCSGNTLQTPRTICEMIQYNKGTAQEKLKPPETDRQTSVCRNFEESEHNGGLTI